MAYRIAHTVAQKERSVEWLFYLIAFCTGAAGLIYEILWNRYLLLIFGSTTYAAAGILAAFIGGLAIGSFWSASLMRRIKKPLLVFIALQLVVAFSALAFPVLVSHWSDGFFRKFLSASSEGEIAIGLIWGLIPTIAMGASFPILVCSRERVGEKSERAPGLFYGWDTLGATVGAVATGFFLVPELGMRASLIVGVGLTAASILLALYLHIRERTSPIFNEDVSTSSTGSGPQRSWIVSMAILISGIASFGFEIVWTRILVLIIGSSTYAFTITVAAFVFGTAVGSLLMSKRINRLRSPLEVFIHTEIGIAILALFTLYFYGKMPGFYIELVNRLDSATEIFSIQALVVGVLMFPPVSLIGASFPLAVKILDTNRTDQRESFGLVFGWISTGNVLGVFITTFLLIPWFGLQESTVALSIVTLCSGLLLLLTFPKVRGRRFLLILAPSLIITVIVFAPKWDRVLMTSGVYTKLPVYRELAGTEENFNNLLNLHRMKYYNEGLQSLVSVVEMPSFTDEPYYALAIDGKIDASTGIADMRTQVLSGHIPFILGRHPRKVLVIGLASGITAGAIGLHAVQNITVIDIEPAMAEAAWIFDKFNHHVLEDQRVRIVVDDGRHHLNVHREQYDLIVSEPSNPWMSGPSRLFTQEFFNLVKRRLASGGIFAQWVPLYGMGEPYYRSITKTFLTEFPHAVAFRVSDGDLLLVGSAAPIKISMKRLKALFEHPKIKKDLFRLDLDAPASFLVRWMGGARTLQELSKDAPLNTDDNGFVEFGSPKYLYQQTLTSNLALSLSRQPMQELTAYIDTDKPASSTSDLLLNIAESAIRQNENDTFGAIKKIFESEGDSIHVDYLMALEAERSENWRGALQSYQHVTQLDPSFQQVYARLLSLYVKLNLTDKAQAVLDKSSQQLHQSNFWHWQGMIQLQRNEPRRALESFSRIVPEQLSEPEIFLHLYRYIAGRRIKNNSVVTRSRAGIMKSLQSLRSKGEMDKDPQTIGAVINQLDPQRNVWLHADERKELQTLIVHELVEPLDLYNKGVNFVLTGQLGNASAVFRRLSVDLSLKDDMTKATYFLRLIQQAMNGF